MWRAESQADRIRGKHGFCVPRALKNYLKELIRRGRIDWQLAPLVKHLRVKRICARYGANLGLPYNPECKDDGMPVEDVWRFADESLRARIDYDFATYNCVHNSRQTLVDKMLDILASNEPCIVSSSGHAYVATKARGDRVHTIDTSPSSISLRRLSREIETVILCFCDDFTKLYVPARPART